MALDDNDGKKPEYNKMLAAELERQARDRQELEESQRQAMADMLENARKNGREELELVELRKSIEDQHDKHRQELLQEQQNRRDLFDLLYRGPPSEREKIELEIRIALGTKVRER